jgi:hypothetical protein
MAEDVADAASLAGHAVQSIRVPALDIAPCDGCGDCWTPAPVPCVLRDDMDSVYPMLRAADVLVFATHGLLPGEMGQSAEPGLVLTPPGSADARNCGLHARPCRASICGLLDLFSLADVAKAAVRTHTLSKTVHTFSLISRNAGDPPWINRLQGAAVSAIVTLGICPVKRVLSPCPSASTTEVCRSIPTSAVSSAENITGCVRPIRPSPARTPSTKILPVPPRPGPPPS